MGALIGPMFISASLWGSSNEEMKSSQCFTYFLFLIDSNLVICSCNFYFLFCRHIPLIQTCSFKCSIKGQNLDTNLHPPLKPHFQFLASLSENQLMSTLTLASFFSTKAESAIKLG